MLLLKRTVHNSTLGSEFLYFLLRNEGLRHGASHAWLKSVLKKRDQDLFYGTVVCNIITPALFQMMAPI